MREQRGAIQRGMLFMVAVALTGCMTTYQPLTGLHRPIALDTRYANFPNLTLSLECVVSPALKAEDAQKLCRKLTQLFENQGAEVLKAQAQEEEGVLERGPRRVATLNVRISARVVYEELSRFLWWKWISDYTFAQETEIRDERGFLLAQDTLIGRFTRRIGFSGMAKRRFSDDLYGQLSQLALNARMRRAVLREGIGGG